MHPNFKWEAVKGNSNEPYVFPAPLSRSFRLTYCVPAIYRWHYDPKETGPINVAYVGQTDDLANRVQQVLRAATTSRQLSTDKRLNQHFLEAIGRGWRIFLDFLDFNPFEIDGCKFSQRELYHPFKRLALENIALCLELQARTQLLNRYVDAEEHLWKKLTKHMSPAEIRRMVDKIIAKEAKRATGGTAPAQD